MFIVEIENSRKCKITKISTCTKRIVTGILFRGINKRRGITIESRRQFCSRIMHEYVKFINSRLLILKNIGTIINKRFDCIPVFF